jgi:hypothetical protein
MSKSQDYGASMIYLPIQTLKAAYRAAIDTGESPAAVERLTKGREENWLTLYSRSVNTGTPRDIENSVRPSDSNKSLNAEDDDEEETEEVVQTVPITRGRKESLAQRVQSIVIAQAQVQVQILAEQQRLAAEKAEEEMRMQQRKIFFEGALEKSSPKSALQIWQVFIHEIYQFQVFQVIDMLILIKNKISATLVKVILQAQNKCNVG